MDDLIKEGHDVVSKRPARDRIFETARRTEIPRERSVGVLLSGQVIAILLNQDHVRRDDRCHIVGLGCSRFVDGSHPTLQPIVLIRVCDRAAVSLQGIRQLD